MYDFIIAGGGAAGLSLAYYLTMSPLSGSRVLVIDRAKKDANDRTWCFWADAPSALEEVVYRKWDAIHFYGESNHRRIPLSPYQYRMIRGIDFYNHVHTRLAAYPNVEFLYGNVDAIHDGTDHARVVVDGREYTASYVFDSLFIPREFQVDRSRHHFVMQHFLGWFITTPTPAFDPSSVTLFDFRTPQRGSMRFFYILPFSSTQALVEYTLFSPNLLERSEYVEALTDYVRDVLGLESYEITEEEDGIIPMTDKPFPRKAGHRIMYTGTKGGMVKASTGFAFLRTQRDSQAIVNSLVQNGHPFHGQRPPRRYHTFDAMLLDILQFRGELSEHIFTSLFLKNPPERLFRFLDEEGSLLENLALMNSVPWGPFIRSWFRVKGGHLS